MIPIANPWRALLLLALLAGGLHAPLARAEEDEDPFDGRLLPVELIMAHRRAIALTPEQSRRIGEHVVALQKAVAELEWQMQSSFFELLEVLDQPKIDEEEALRLADAAVGTENLIKLEQMRLLIRVRNLLTPAQVAQLRELRDDGKAG